MPIPVLATENKTFLPDRFCVEVPNMSTKNRKYIYRLYLHIESVIGAGDRYLCIHNEMLNAPRGGPLYNVSRILEKLKLKEWVMSKSFFKDKLPRDYVTEYLDDGRRAIGYQWSIENE
jgi:hypothetical protein